MSEGAPPLDRRSYWIGVLHSFPVGIVVTVLILIVVHTIMK